MSSNDDLSEVLISVCEEQCALSECYHPHVQAAIRAIPAKIEARLRALNAKKAPKKESASKTTKTT